MGILNNSFPSPIVFITHIQDLSIIRVIKSTGNPSHAEVPGIITGIILENLAGGSLNEVPDRKNKLRRLRILQREIMRLSLYWE